MKKAIIKYFLAIVLVLTLFVPASVSASSSFKDVKGHWAEKDIENLHSLGLIEGTPLGYYHPNKTLTRAEFVTIIGKMFPEGESDKVFSDVKKGDWFYEEVHSAVALGIIEGYPDGTFKPRASISRQEMAFIIDQVLQLNGDYSNTAKNNFRDSNKVSAYAKVAVNRMIAYNLIYGKTELYFKPLDSSKRSEAAALINRMVELIGFTGVLPEEPVDPVDPVDPEEPVEKHYRDMTLAELKQEYGTRVLVERIDGYYTGGGVITRDLIETYYKELHSEYGHMIPDPLTYIADLEEQFQSLAGHYSSWYPKYEVISYKGKSYVDSDLYNGSGILNFNALKFLDLSILPSNPDAKGQVLVDLHTYSNKYGVYYSDDTKVGDMKELLYQTNGVWMVDAVSVLKHFGKVTQTTDSITFEYPDNVIKLDVGKTTIIKNGTNAGNLNQAVAKRNNTIVVPLREVSELLGLDTRVYERGVGRIEIANYDLAPDYK